MNVPNRAFWSILAMPVSDRTREGAGVAEPAVQIKTYKKADEYQCDANRLAKVGWEVVAVNHEPAKSFWLGWIGRKLKGDRYVVTYRRAVN